MAIEDKAKTTFVTPWGTYCYKVMPFGLKNAGATYQRAMMTLFHDMIHKEIEVYVDDMIAKSNKGEDHVKVLRKLFERLRKYKLKLNPTKCLFGVKSGKLLGFVVSNKVYMTKKVVKGSAITDHLADNAVEDYEPLDFDFPDENVLSIAGEEEKTDWWTMFFDGAVNVYGNGASAVIISPEQKQYPVSVKLYFECTNNTAKYEACILGLEAALELKEYLAALSEELEEIRFTHLGREGNHFADALATLAVMATIDLGHKEYPVEASKMDKKTLRRLAMDFYLDGEILYKRSFDGTLLRCLNEIDAKNALREVHEGICSTHANGHMIARKIQRAGYFWMTLEKDCIDYVRKCHKCQEHSNKANAPPTPLINLASPWPFAMWGIDVIGPVNPKTSNGHRFILVAIDYFTKWVEASSYAHQNDRGALYQMKNQAFNKNIKKIMQKMVVTYKDWHEMLPFALYAYHTVVRTSTGTTLYALVYGMEAVMPLEVEIPSLRVLMDSRLEEAEWAKVRYE
nr:uncharacterized protein LOC118053664 [Populus alba]